ncbi:type VI secretion system protein TssA [Paraburkholderia sp. CNPSo 3274]|uniref:type VI secretion system protein TssA n=1 Tax=Paraburkholderia sp. CNPSo 3274 TaxID=2940932 RepID=UPI0020B6DC1B|nr:type VI secretion system protein TssA [Paraburkholderia sp. CNPSo 3274]MCP3708643.1 type VI secretion system protein TssA [Paraburkholderia sp. CNPSo 3274]
MFANFIEQLFGARNPDELARERFSAWEAWLKPLPSADGKGVGRDPGYDDAFIAVKEEIGKLSEIDDKLIVQNCQQMICEVGKDLRLAGYYVFARVRQEGAAGLSDGLELIAALVDRFGHALLPARDEAKRSAIEWVATARVLEQLDRHGEFAPAELERAMAALNLLIGKTAEWPETAHPNLQALVSRFEGGEDVLRPVTESSTAMPGGSGSLSAGVTAIASTRDALEYTRVLAKYLRDEEHGYLPAARLVRCMRWDTVHEVPPADPKGHTRLAPPRAELRQQFKRLVLQKQWLELLERVEGAYMEGDNHLWLDLQYYQQVALDHAGSPYTEWRDILKTDFALFLERMPGVQRLAFNDGTPFADDATLEWIAGNAVVRNLDQGEALAALPVSTDGEDGAVANWQEMEIQARELAQSQGIEAAFAWIDALPGIRTDRQRYLQRWVMARVADHAGRPDICLRLLAELDAGGPQFRLAGWEPSLTFEVKHHLLKTLKASMNRKDADKPAITRQIEKLGHEMTVLDPARAVAVL